MSEIAWPWCFKSVVTGGEPTSWNGGCGVELYKDSGPMQSISSYRGVALGNQIGKVMDVYTARETEQHLCENNQAYVVRCRKKQWMRLAYAEEILCNSCFKLFRDDQRLQSHRTLANGCRHEGRRIANEAHSKCKG